MFLSCDCNVSQKMTWHTLVQNNKEKSNFLSAHMSQHLSFFPKKIKLLRIFFIVLTLFSHRRQSMETTIPLDMSTSTLAFLYRQVIIDFQNCHWSLFYFMCSSTRLVVGLEIMPALVVHCYISRSGAGNASQLDGRKCYRRKIIWITSSQQWLAASHVGLPLGRGLTIGTWSPSSLATHKQRIGPTLTSLTNLSWSSYKFTLFHFWYVESS
jgi:hypothetical protein